MARLFNAFINPSRVYHSALKFVAYARPGYVLMRPSRRALLKIALLLAVGSPIAAQQAQPPSDPALLTSADSKERLVWANQWLQSGDPRRIAWAAWLVRQDHQTSLVPALLDKLAAYEPTETFSSQAEADSHDAMLAILDTLISLGTPVPSEHARKLYPEFPAQSLILLVRSQGTSQPALLEIFRTARANWNWLAAGNALMQWRVPGFAAVLLSRFTQHVTVSVVDPGYGVGGSGTFGSECGFSMRAPKALWPAVGLYQLTQFPERLTGVPATFLVGVYFLRAEPGNYDNPGDERGGCNDGDRDGYRAEYLAKLIESASMRVNLEAYPFVSITWYDEANYKERLLAAIEEQRALFQRAVVALSQCPGQIVSPTEAQSLKPRIEVVIRDDRNNKSIALPAVLKQDETLALHGGFTRPLD